MFIMFLKRKKYARPVYDEKKYVLVLTQTNSSLLKNIIKLSMFQSCDKY